MGIFDKGKNLLGGHEKKIDDTLDKVAETIDEKTGGKHSDKIEQGVDGAKDFVDRLTDDDHD